MSATPAKVLLDAETAVAQLRALAEPTRIRIVALLAYAELSVKELTQVLGQSQPRISRHLKLLAEAGLISRFKEGAWVNIRLADSESTGRLVIQIVDLLDVDDTTFALDRRRAESLIEERARTAERYFARHAAEWDEIRSLHVEEARVETQMLAALGDGPFRNFLDVGTGTGRILELFADRFERGLGIDSNPSMLAYARSRLESGRISHAQVRQGDLFNIGSRDRAFDAVVIHQVLHFLSDTQAAVHELARVLAPDGRLLIVDFAPHDLAFLRERHAHQLMGIGELDMAAWLASAGLCVEQSTTLEPLQGKSREALTVTLWLATHVSAQKQADRQGDKPTVNAINSSQVNASLANSSLVNSPQLAGAAEPSGEVNEVRRSQSKTNPTMEPVQ